MHLFREPPHALPTSLGGRDIPLDNPITLSRSSINPSNPDAVQTHANWSFRHRKHDQRDGLLFNHNLSLLLLLLLLVVACLSAPAAALSCGSTLECKNGGVCVRNRTGDDVCDCPNPRSALEPEFFVGTECEVPAVMCADTDTFFCGNGAQCVEIVQGEQYSCEGCPQGYGGQHCESHGVQCGDSGLLCFNGGSCGHSGTSCVCPRQWSGNANCTLSLFDAYHQQASPYGSQAEEEDQSWYVPVLGAFGALVMLSILGVWIYICYAHQAMSSFSHIADQEESRALQDDVEERELVELDSHGDEDEGRYSDDEDGEAEGERRRGRRRKRHRHSRRRDYNEDNGGGSSDENYDDEGGDRDGDDDGDDDDGGGDALNGRGHGGFRDYRDRRSDRYYDRGGGGKGDEKDGDSMEEESDEDIEEGERVPLR